MRIPKDDLELSAEPVIRLSWKADTVVRRLLVAVRWLTNAAIRERTADDRRVDAGPVAPLVTLTRSLPSL